MKLQKRLLGSTDFSASILGIGDLADRSVPLEQCVAATHRAMDFGLNLIDTASGYEDGYSEAIVGEALRGSTASATGRWRVRLGLRRSSRLRIPRSLRSATRSRR